MSRQNRPFENTKFPNPNSLEPIAARVSYRLPVPHSERRGTPASHQQSYRSGSS